MTPKKSHRKKQKMNEQSNPWRCAVQEAIQQDARNEGAGTFLKKSWGGMRVLRATTIYSEYEFAFTEEVWRKVRQQLVDMAWQKENLNALHNFKQQAGKSEHLIGSFHQRITDKLETCGPAIQYARTHTARKASPQCRDPPHPFRPWRHSNSHVSHKVWFWQQTIPKAHEALSGEDKATAAPLDSEGLLDSIFLNSKEFY